MGSQGNHSSLPDSILKYQHYLRNRYVIMPSEFPFIRHRPEHAINLVLVRKERQNGLSQEIKFAFHGKVDEIQKLKTSIKVDEIGSTLKTNVAAHFVLIEGAPGIGKSTLCWQLCRLWSEGKLRHEWDLVVLVEIRDETLQKATSIYDLLYHHNDKIRKSLAQEIQKREGEGLMIIFDGYDELSFDQLHSEFSIILQILSYRILEKATIVVTSRPTAANRLPQTFVRYLDEHIVIAGFSKYDIETYIRSACHDNIKMSQSLHSYISSRPFILSFVHNPLHCAIVTELYIEYWLARQEIFAPITLTELYSALVLNLLRRSLLLSSDTKELADIDELTDLPTHVYNNLMQLAKLAATGLETRQYIYQNVSHNTFGLMVSVRQFFDKRAYMFLHLTLQQYLSALYWSKQPKQQQFDYIQRQNILDNIIIKYHRFGHDEESNWPHLLFLAGLTKLASFPLEKMLPNNLKAMYIGPMCQLLFETQSSQAVSNVFGHRRLEVNLGLSNHFDWFAIGYCIVNSDKTNSSWNIPKVESPQELKLLSDGLHFSDWERAVPSQINMNSSKLAINMTIRTSANEYFKIFPKLYPFTKAISHLNLSHPTYLDDDGFSVLQNISHYCPNMQTLYLLLDFESFVLIESPRLPKETLVTIGLALPQFSVVFDSLHEYSKLRELHLYAKDR